MPINQNLYMELPRPGYQNLIVKTISCRKFQTHFRIDVIISYYLLILFIFNQIEDLRTKMVLYDRLCILIIINICYIISGIVHFI